MQERGQERNSPRTTGQPDSQRERTVADTNLTAARMPKPLAAELVMAETVAMVFSPDPTVADPNLGVPIVHQVVDQMGLN